MDFLIIFPGIIFIFGLIAFNWFNSNDAPFVTTKIFYVKKMLENLNIKKGDIFYELGSGDGRVVIEAAKKGAYAIGIEQSVIRVFISKLLAQQNNLKNTNFINKNFFSINYKNADFVYIFLLPDALEKLKPKLKKELKKDSIIITHAFHFNNWRPYKKILVTQPEVPNKKIGPYNYDGEFWFYKT